MILRTDLCYLVYLRSISMVAHSVWMSKEALTDLPVYRSNPDSIFGLLTTDNSGIDRP